MRDTPCAQTTMVSQPRGTEDVDEEEKKVESQMAGSFSFGDRGSGVACEAGVLLICSMLLVCLGICGGGWCGQGHPSLRALFVLIFFFFFLKALYLDEYLFSCL